MPSTSKVLEAAQSGEFDLPPGCSVEYELTAIELLQAMAKTSGRAGLEEYCRAHTEEEGLRPSAAQAFRAGFNPRAAHAKHGSWFGMLGELGLLSTSEADVVARSGDALAGFETEHINKSYKLVVLRALLHDGAIRSGASVADLARTSRELIVKDPRLRADVSDEFPDLAAADARAWEEYWRKWPIAAWAGDLRGQPGRWFRLEDERLLPNFRVEAEHAETFDAMAAELLEYRLTRYLLGKEPAGPRTWTCKVGHADGRPLIWLDRKRNPDLPSNEVPFVAGGHEYVGRFMKVAMNVATAADERGNGLHPLLRGWFGPSAGHPGTNHEVVFEQSDGTLGLRPRVVERSRGAQVVPLFPSYEVACGPFAAETWTDLGGVPLSVHTAPGEVLNASSQFACFARGDSMDGGSDPIRHGDPLLFDWARNVGAADLVGERVLVEHTTKVGTAATLKLLERDGRSFALTSTNPSYERIPTDASMRVVARLNRRLDHWQLNPLAEHLGETFKRQDIPPLYGLEYNPGNWQSGHVSIPGHAILFVTLQKSEHMAYGAEYVDHLESSEFFVWSSQTSTAPESKKGREIIEAMVSGTLIHLWARRKKSDVAFSYLGAAVPLSHEDSKPMSVRFRLLTPVSDDVWRRLHG